MIPLPTRRRLERRRDELYDRLLSILQHASVHQVEDIMRRVHIINIKLRTYFIQKENEKKQTSEDH